jgi:predicted hydrocarbon binding protein
VRRKVTYTCFEFTYNGMVMVDERYPKDVIVGIYAPGRRLFEFSLKIKNMPEAIAEVSGILAKKGVNLLSGFHLADPTGEEARWGFIADLSGLDIEVEELLKLIMGLKLVSDVSFTEAKFNGLIVDELHFPLTALGERSVLLRVETWGDMAGGLFEAFGSGACVILYEMGVKAGENKARNVVEKYGVHGLRALQIILAERVAKGWGVPNVVEFDEKKFKATVTVQDLFECLPFKGKDRQPKSHFFRGYITGVFNNLFNKKVAAEEVECIAKGDKICKFTIK